MERISAKLHKNKLKHDRDNPYTAERNVVKEASKDVDFAVNFPCINFVKKLQPYKDVEDHSIVRRTRNHGGRLVPGYEGISAGVRGY